MKKSIKLFFLTIVSIIFILGLIKGFNKPFFSFYLFTRQTVLLINIYFIILCFLLNNKLNKYLSFICLINCLLLSLCNFKIENLQLFNQRNTFEILVSNLEHIILPLIFFYYYFLVDKTFIKLKYFGVALIHPFIYSIVCFLTKNAPYKFLNLTFNFKNLLFYIIFLLLISYISFLLILIKMKMIKRYQNKKINI